MINNDLFMAGFDDGFSQYDFNEEAAYKAFTYGLISATYDEPRLAFEANDVTQKVTVFSDPGPLVYGRYTIPEFYEYCVENHKTNIMKNILNKLWKPKLIAVIVGIVIILFGVRVVSSTLRDMTVMEKVSAITSPVDTISEKLFQEDEKVVAEDKKSNALAAVLTVIFMAVIGVLITSQKDVLTPILFKFTGRE